MSRRREIDPATVVWHAPETIHRTLPEAAEKFAAAIKDAGPDDIVRLANARRGEFRELVGTEIVDAAERPVYGDERLVWVDDAPDDNEDPAGHFEVFTGEDADYEPVRRDRTEG